MIKPGTDITIEVPVIFENGKTRIERGRQRTFMCRDRVRDIDHSYLHVSIFLN